MNTAPALANAHLDVLDASASPLIYARFRHAFTRTDFDRFARWHDEQVLAAQRAGTWLISVCDLRHTDGTVNAADRRHMSTWMQRGAPMNAAAVGLSVLVTGNPIHTGIIRALHWLSPPPTPVLVVSTLDAAWRAVVAGAERLAICDLQQPPSWR